MPLQGSQVQVICTVNCTLGAHSTRVPRNNPHKALVDLTTVDDGILKPTKCLTLLLQNAKRVMEHVGFTMYRISRLSLVEAQFRKPLVAAQVQAAMLWNSCSLVCRKPGVEGLHSYAAWNCDRWACKWSRLIVQVRKRSRLCSEAVPCPSLKCKKGCRKIIFPKCKAQNNLLRAHSRPNRITGWQSRQLKAKIPMFHDFSLKSMNLDFGKITGFLP